MFKNIASQKLTVLIIDTVTNLPKTADAANLTAYVSKDDGAVTVLADTSATEADATNAPGLYLFDLAQAETNADKLVFSGKSTTSGVRVVPVTIYTTPANFSTLSVDGSGRIDLAKWIGVAPLALSSQQVQAIVPDAQKVDVNTIKTQAVTAAAGVTFPSSVASPTNITAGTITTATNVTTVNGLAAGVITAASIAADAITDAKVASDVTIASVTGAVGSVTGAVGSVTGSVGSIASGGITTASFAAGAINAAAIAADAITDAKVAADVTIASVTGAVGSVTGAVGSVTGSVGSVVGEVGSVTGAVGSVTGNVGGNVVGSTGSVTGTVGGIAGTTQTLDALQTALNSAHGAGSWATATGFSTLDAAGVRTAVGLGSANLDTQLGDLPTNAELATALGTADDAVLAAIGALNNLSQANVRTAVGLATANLDTQLAALDVDILTRLPTASYTAPLSAAGTRTALGLASANLDTQFSSIFTTAMTESYAANGVAPTPAQALFAIQQSVIEFSIAGVTLTVKKVDHSTDALTCTLNSATDPTSRTRAT